MSFIESVLKKTKRIERLLSEHFQAVGKGLTEKTNNVEHQLPSYIVNKLRFIASVRNKLLHVDGYEFDRNQDRFLDDCDKIIQYLEANERQASLGEFFESDEPFIEANETHFQDFILQSISAAEHLRNCHTSLIYTEKPKISSFKRFLIILGGLCLFGFIFSATINIFFYFVRQRTIQHNQQNESPSQLSAFDSRTLNSFVGVYDCKKYKMTISKDGNTLKVSSSKITATLTPISDREFRASDLSNNFQFTVKFNKISAGFANELVITEKKGYQEQCKKVN
jgi:hypothetical protein